MLKIFEDKRGVSQVVGVILMVSITVILAAVIAASVLGQTNLVETPQAAIVIDEIITDDISGIYVIELLHNSGDPLMLIDVKIVIHDSSQQSSLSIDPVSTDSSESFHPGDNLDIFVDGASTYVQKNFANLSIGAINGLLSGWTVGNELQVFLYYKHPESMFSNPAQFMISNPTEYA